MKCKLLIFLLMSCSFLLKAQEDTLIGVKKVEILEGNKSKCILPNPESDSEEIRLLKTIPGTLLPFLKIKGFVDAYYSYDLSLPPNNLKPLFQYNYNRHNEFSINLALLQLEYDNGKTRGGIGLMAGTYAQYNLAHEQELMRHIYEAYGGAQLINNLWLDAGIFGSHLGFASLISNENITLTRSIMAESSPYYLSGAKLTYSGIENFTLMGIISNGWQNISENVLNENKAIGTQIIYKPTSKMIINYSTMWSDEGDTVKGNTRIFNDLYAIYEPTNKIKIISAFDYGIEKNTTNNSWSSWYAPAILVGYVITEKTSFGTRIEYYKDKNGVIVQSNFDIIGTSLNLDYKPSNGVVLRLEGKWLNSKDKIFEQSNSSFKRDNIGITASLAINFWNWIQ